MPASIGAAAEPMALSAPFPDPDGAAGPLKPRCPQNPLARRQLANLLFYAKDYSLLTF